MLTKRPHETKGVPLPSEWNDQILKTEPGVIDTLESVVEIPEHLKSQVLPIFKDIVHGQPKENKVIFLGLI